MLQKGDKEEWLSELRMEGQNLEKERAGLETEGERLAGRIEVLRNLVRCVKTEDMRKDVQGELAEYETKLDGTQKQEGTIKRRLKYIRKLEDGIENAD